MAVEDGSMQADLDAACQLLCLRNGMLLTDLRAAAQASAAPAQHATDHPPLYLKRKARALAPVNAPLHPAKSPCTPPFTSVQWCKAHKRPRTGPCRVPLNPAQLALRVQVLEHMAGTTEMPHMPWQLPEVSESLQPVLRKPLQLDLANAAAIHGKLQLPEVLESAAPERPIPPKPDLADAAATLRKVQLLGTEQTGIISPPLLTASTPVPRQPQPSSRPSCAGGAAAAFTAVADVLRTEVIKYISGAALSPCSSTSPPQSSTPQQRGSNSVQLQQYPQQLVQQRAQQHPRPPSFVEGAAVHVNCSLPIDMVCVSLPASQHMGPQGSWGPLRPHLTPCTGSHIKPLEVREETKPAVTCMDSSHVVRPQHIPGSGVPQIIMVYSRRGTGNAAHAGTGTSCSGAMNISVKPSIRVVQPHSSTPMHAAAAAVPATQEPISPGTASATESLGPTAGDMAAAARHLVEDCCDPPEAAANSEDNIQGAPAVKLVCSLYQATSSTGPSRKPHSVLDGVLREPHIRQQARCFEGVTGQQVDGSQKTERQTTDKGQWWPRNTAHTDVHTPAVLTEKVTAPLPRSSVGAASGCLPVRCADSSAACRYTPLPTLASQPLPLGAYRGDLHARVLSSQWPTHQQGRSVSQSMGAPWPVSRTPLPTLVRLKHMAACSKSSNAAKYVLPFAACRTNSAPMQMMQLPQNVLVGQPIAGQQVLVSTTAMNHVHAAATRGLPHSNQLQGIIVAKKRCMAPAAGPALGPGALRGSGLVLTAQGGSIIPGRPLCDTTAPQHGAAAYAAADAVSWRLAAASTAVASEH